MNKETYDKIQKYLYNYQNTDKIISDIKSDIMDCSNLGYNNWIKSKTNNGITLEDKVVEAHTNKAILKIQKWKKLITDVLNYYKENSNIKYQYICLKYFKKLSISEIESKLQLDKYKQRDMQKEILQHIFLCSVKEKLLKNI